MVSRQRNDSVKINAIDIPTKSGRMVPCLLIEFATFDTSAIPNLTKVKNIEITFDHLLSNMHRGVITPSAAT